MSLSHSAFLVASSRTDFLAHSSDNLSFGYPCTSRRRPQSRNTYSRRAVHLYTEQKQTPGESSLHGSSHGGASANRDTAAAYHRRVHVSRPRALLLLPAVVRSIFAALRSPLQPPIHVSCEDGRDTDTCTTRSHETAVRPSREDHMAV